MRKRIGAALLLALGLAAVPAVAQVDIPDFQQSGSYGGDIRNRAKLHTELAALYFQDGKLAVALEETQIAIRIDSSYAPAYNMRALVYAALREFALAESDFQQAFRLAPSDPDVNNNYGWYLCQRGREKDAITHFLNAIKNPLYSTPDRAYTNAGACALRAGDLDAAADYLQRAVSMSRDGAPLAKLQQAKLAYMRGNVEAARQLLMETLRVMQRPTAEALWLGVRVERKLGNKAEEGSLVAQLRRLYPASAEYQEFLKGNYE